MATITIEVDHNIKTAFETANPETRQQLSSIIELFFRSNLQEKTLTEVMAEIGDRAQKRG